MVHSTQPPSKPVSHHSHHTGADGVSKLTLLSYHVTHHTGHMTPVSHPRSPHLPPKYIEEFKLPLPNGCLKIVLT